MRMQEIMDEMEEGSGKRKRDERGREKFGGYEMG